MPPEELRSVLIRRLEIALDAEHEVKLEDWSNLLPPSFGARLLATLKVHENFLNASLATELFEAAFIESAEYAGLTVERARGGARFWDVRVEGFHFSLKSTAARDIKEGYLHISKLCEAAWIQDVRSARDRSHATKALFAEYLELVDAIIVLRYFREKQDYELVKIPSSLLQPILDLPDSAFAADGPTIWIPNDAEQDLQLKLDRSDAKITLARISKARCHVYARWHIPRRQS